MTKNASNGLAAARCFGMLAAMTLHPKHASDAPSQSLKRRDFAKLTLAALPGLALFSSVGNAADAKSSGVRIGMNVPYSFGKADMSGEEIIKNCSQLGLNGLELRAQPVEVFMGASADLIFPKKSNEPGAAAARTKQLTEWRKSAPLDRAKDFRKKSEAAGLFIEVMKVDNIFKLTHDELDYMFTLAKTLGSYAISSEISHTESDLKKVGQFADKHQLLVAYHGHASTGPEHWLKAFELAKYNGANVDLGHFVAGLNTSPVPFIKEHHERISHVHVKDRKKNNGPNTPFGEGETPIVETLRLIRDNKWKIQATIEFEYKVPAGSDRMKELAKCVRYCQDALA